MPHLDAENRRAFLKRLSALGLASVGASTVLSACGGGDGQAPASESAADAPATADATTCNDLSGLTEAEVQMRENMVETLQYVTESPVEGQYCNNCQLWVPPEGDTVCGGCTLIKGPIAPQGYCNSWVERAA